MDKLTISMLLFLLLTAMATSNRRRRGTAEIRKQYKCLVPEIVNRTECEHLMANPLLEAFRKSLALVTESVLRKAQKRSRKGQRYNCPSNGLQHFNASFPAGQRSLSPYHDTIDYNKRRIPSYIIEKRCLCRGCINPETEKETRTLKSVPLSVSVEVFRKRRGSRSYVKETVQVSVGCTCVIPILKHQK